MMSCEANYFHVIFVLIAFCTASCAGDKPGGAVSITSSNYDGFIGKHELVFLNFYADWCHFSGMLQPIFDETSQKITKEFPEPGRVMLGKVDCDAEVDIARRFHITKYPTLKFIQNGKVLRREYRGQRSVDGMSEHIRNLLKDPIVQIVGNDGTNAIDEKRAALVAYLESQADSSYNTLRKVAMDLRDDCQFFAVTGEAAKSHPPSNRLVFKPKQVELGEKDEAYTSAWLNYEELRAWAEHKCVPLVREITFENAEELTEEGLPFLILFYHPDDKKSVAEFSKYCEKDLTSESGSINFLTADGIKFAHPLHHLGKAVTDLPLIAIDSFRHMYLFPKYSDINIPGKLKHFVTDLHSGKLHREFHYGPEEITENQNDVIQSTSPPDSTFRKLAPSRNRYTILRDEL